MLAANNAVFPETPTNPIGIGGNDIAAVQPVAANMAAPVSSPVSAVNIVVPSITEPAVDIKDMLVLKLREDSWIEIKKSDRSTLIARLVKAGTTETFNITGPVSLTVGNASGVDATLRGTPLALQSDAKSNVARLTLK
jgi:cytoskeleton protein RodZ